MQSDLHLKNNLKNFKVNFKQKLIVPAKVVLNYFENGGLLTNSSVSKL